MSNAIQNYCKKENISVANLAKQANARPMVFYKYVNYGRIPNPDFMKRIFLVTDGEVTPNDLHKVELWKKELKNDQVGNNVKN